MCLRLNLRHLKLNPIALAMGSLIERSYNGKIRTSEGNEVIIPNVMVLKEFEAFDCSKF